MSVQYSNSLPTNESFWDLFATTDWNREYKLSGEELMKAVANSWYLTAAYDGDRLVGFGRVVSDGVLHAMIYDLITHPDFQERGIGTQILHLLVKKCRDAGIRDIQLFSARGKKSFYEKRSFRARTEDAPGMEYIEPN